MAELFTEALERFEALYAEARGRAASEAGLMALATAGSDGRPSVRMVNFTGLHNGSFTFFASRISGKGQQLQASPWAGLCFYWPAINQQIVIDGKVTEMPADDADRLWKSRSRSAALMAWASQQSMQSAGRSDLDERYRHARERFSDERVPRPAEWMAYAVQAHRIEFWCGGWDRRHEREAYLQTPEGWQHLRLNP